MDIKYVSVSENKSKLQLAVAVRQLIGSSSTVLYANVLTFEKPYVKFRKEKIGGTTEISQIIKLPLFLK